MGIFDEFNTSTNNSSSGTIPTTPKITASTKSNGGIFSDFTIPSKAVQDKAVNDSQVRLSTKATQQASDQANSFGGMIKNTLTGIPKAAKDVAGSLYDTAGGLVAPGITHDELRNPQIIKDTITGLPKSVYDIGKKIVTHPIQSAQSAVGGAARGVSDFVTNAIINLTPTKLTGANRDNLKSSVSDTLDKYLSPDVIKDDAIAQGFKVAGSTAPLIAAGGILGETAGLSQVIDKAGFTGTNIARAKLFAGLGETAGFIASGQSQIALDAHIKDRAKQVLNDLVALGILKIGTEGFSKAKETITDGLKRGYESEIKQPTPDQMKNISGHIDTHGETSAFNSLIHNGTTPEKAIQIIDTIKEGKTNDARENPTKVVGDLVKEHTTEPTTVYSGHAVGEEGITPDTTFHTPDKETAQKYADINKDATGISKVTETNIEGKNFKEVSQKEMQAAIEDPAIRKEYDGVKFQVEGEKNPSYALFTKEKPVTIDRPVADDGTRVTKAANDINEQLIKQGVEALPPEEQSKYQTGSYKKDLETTTELMNTDFEKAKNVATGNEPVPDNIRYPQVLFNAMEAHAIKTGDIQLQIDLAKSPLGKELSEAAGTLGSHGFNDNPNNSPVKLIKKINEAREKSVVKKEGKSIKEAKKGIVDKLKKEARKTSLKRQDWESFVKSIQC